MIEDKLNELADLIAHTVMSYHSSRAMLELIEDIRDLMKEEKCTT